MRRTGKYDNIGFIIKTSYLTKMRIDIVNSTF